MHTLDWLVMLGVLCFIAGYGIYKTRGIQSASSYLKGENDLKWWTIGLSIMATQASAITFLSTPGKAYEDGMGFAQFYFGMPLAMVLLCIFALPIFYRLKVFTAYEYLEGRFDLKTRLLASSLFLVQRGLAAGITIFAPAIILSNILNWQLNTTILFIGIFVIIYTVSGGTKAVSVTHKQQMTIILLGMVIATVILVFKLPADVSFGDALSLAGKMDKLEVINFEFNLKDRYNIWSALLGGTFLFLSYFGTDQSQVQRYLSGRSLAEGRLGLLMNGLIKVPMQFLILLVGVLVFIFFQFTRPPLHFNNANVAMVQESAEAARYEVLETRFDEIFQEKQAAAKALINAVDADNASQIETERTRLNGLIEQDLRLRGEADEVITSAGELRNLEVITKDEDYVFVSFITNYLPIGLVGLLLAVIFSAAMSSTASELNALATTTSVDFYQRVINPNASDQHYLIASKLFTAGWGIIALLFAMFASLFDNLIEAVNYIGSVFYGTILGIFVVAFFLKKVRGSSVFFAALLTQSGVFLLTYLENIGVLDIGYLWYNLIGCIVVVILSWLFSAMSPAGPSSTYGELLDN